MGDFHTGAVEGQPGSGLVDSAAGARHSWERPSIELIPSKGQPPRSCLNPELVHAACLWGELHQGGVGVRESLQNLNPGAGPLGAR
mmetsp:Transcript_18894/g.45144  ORF Transcript_18894/g.45144 Transcript_18894/m.45144 type:complete len:86 (+) Transcript_18894:138-395(+)